MGSSARISALLMAFLHPCQRWPLSVMCCELTFRNSHSGGRVRRADILVCRLRRLSSRQGSRTGLEIPVNREAGKPAPLHHEDWLSFDLHRGREACLTSFAARRTGERAPNCTRNRAGSRVWCRASLALVLPVTTPALRQHLRQTDRQPIGRNPASASCTGHRRSQPQRHKAAPKRRIRRHDLLMTTDR